MGVTKYKDPVTGQWVAESKYEIETILRMHEGADEPTDSSVKVWIKEVDVADDMLIPTTSEIEALIEEKVAEIGGGGGATVEGASVGDLLTVDDDGNITNSGISTTNLADGTYVVGKANIANNATNAATAENATKLNGQEADYYTAYEDFVDLARDLSEMTGSWTMHNFPDTDTLDTMKVVYLSPSGSDDNTGLSADDPMLTVTAVLNKFKGAYGLQLSLAAGTYALDATNEINGFNYLHFKGASGAIINATGGALTFANGTVHISNLTLNTESGVVFNGCVSRLLVVTLNASNTSSVKMITNNYGTLAAVQCVFGNCAYGVYCTGGFASSANNTLVSGAAITSYSHYATQGALIVENCSGSLGVENRSVSSTIVSTGATSTTTAQVRQITLTSSAPDEVTDGSIVAVYE